jgi:hypothetical protein
MCAWNGFVSDLFTNIGEAEVFSCRRRRHCPGSKVKKKYLGGGVGGRSWSTLEVSTKKIGA